jgi:methyltransferase
MVTELAFSAVVLAVGAQRLFELRLSRRNEARLRARGGRELAPRQMLAMTALHSAWLAATPLEVLLAQRELDVRLAVPAAVVFSLGQALRYAAMHGLGERWCVKIITLPGGTRVTSGIYSRLRHPNYLGVALEIAALPLLHGAWVTALGASALNGVLLWRRIRAEERALGEEAGSRTVFDTKLPSHCPVHR